MTVDKASTPKGSWRDWAEDVLLRGLIFSANLLPLAPRLAVMGWVVRRIVAPITGWRARAEANLAHVWPDMPATERTAIAQAALDNLGRTMIENYDVAGLLRRMASAPISGAGVPALEDAKRNGQPVMFVTGHYGNFEAPRAALVARGYKIGGLYRPMSNPYFNRHYAANMHALSDPVFAQGRRGTAGLLRHIRSGGMAVLLFDVYDSAGVPINFLGRPAPTLLSAADIALKSQALLVPFFGVRDGKGYRLEFDAPIPHTTADDMMRAATQALEARITADPAQWIWIHRRWKPKRQAKRQRKRAAATMAP